MLPELNVATIEEISLLKTKYKTGLWTGSATNITIIMLVLEGAAKGYLKKKPTIQITKQTHNQDSNPRREDTLTIISSVLSVNEDVAPSKGGGVNAVNT